MLVSYLTIGLFRLKSKKSKKINFISIIIAAHNEEEKLRDCLDSVLSQTYSSDSFEILIADDRSTDATPKIAKEYCDQFENVSCVRVEPCEFAIPKKTALARGLEKARGDIIISTDGDCIVTPKWLESMNSYFAANIGMVIGHVNYHKPAHLGSGIDAIDYFSHRALGAAFVGAGSVYTCTAANFAYRKEIYDNVKDEFVKLKVRPAEDNFFINIVHSRTDYLVAVATDAESIVLTEGAQSFKHFFDQRFRWGAYGGNILNIGVQLFFIPVLIFYILIWFGIGGSLFSSSIASAFLISMIIKFSADFFFMLKATHMFKSIYLMKYLPAEWFLHLFLTLVIVIKGNLFSFKWKGKTYTSEKEVL